MGTKRCNTCGQAKPLDEFYEAAGCVDGRRGECRSCFQAKAVARAEADPAICNLRDDPAIVAAALEYLTRRPR